MSSELFCSLKGDRPDAPFREYESLDVFMNNYTEHTWYLVTINAAIKELIQTYVKYPPRMLQSESYSGPITLTQYQRLQNIREQLGRQGFTIGLPSGN
jgi:hypothetical protein